MRPSVRNILRYLAERESQWVAQTRIPDGRGYNTNGRCARGDILRQLRHEGLVEYGKEPLHSLYGYRITPAGLAAISTTGA